MPITIKSDGGSGVGVRIFSEGGADITGALSIESFSLSCRGVNDIVRATLVLGLVKAESQAGIVEWLSMSPVTGKHERVEHMTFADGTSISLAEDGTVFVSSAPDGNGVSQVARLGDPHIRKFRAPAPARSE